MTSRATLAGVLAAFVVGCGERDPPDPGRDRSLAVVIKGLENPFFETMRDGLVAAARDHEVRLRLDTAAGLEDTDGQATALESLARRRASCYVVNPITPTNLLEPLAHLPEGTPIVNIDSPLDSRAARAVGVGVTTYIGTDNVAAGATGARAMARLLDRGARVAVIAGIPGDAGSGARVRGFKAGAAGRLRIVQTVAADFVRSRAQLATAELLRADPKLGGVFAVNDEMALGAADAVRAAGRGDVAVIGMDGIRAALAAVAGGALSATVAQYPYTIGELGVEACLAAIQGARLPVRVDAPVGVVTRGNVARAQAAFPEPIERFENPFKRRLSERRGM
jgi:ABC-type sugar transport system substrate-binding protein